MDFDVTDITIKQLQDGDIPPFWNSIDNIPPHTGFYEALCIVGSVNAKVQYCESKMYKQYDYKNDDGTQAGRWIEGDWIKVMAWRERKL